MEEKEQRFEKLWFGKTPKGYSEQKMLQFRNLMKNRLRQMRVPFNEVNARKLWMSQLTRPRPHEEYYDRRPRDDRRGWDRDRR